MKQWMLRCGSPSASAFDRRALLSLVSAGVIAMSGCGWMGDFGDTIWKSSPDAEQPAGEAAARTPRKLTRQEAVEYLGEQSASEPPASAARTAVGRPAPAGRGGVTGGTAGRTQSIEVLWRVPTDAVERYHVLYGSAPEKLDRSVVIPVAKLQKIDHPKFGPVYRFELPSIPMDEIIYVSLRAENSAGVSPPTPPVKLEPGSKSIMP